MRTGKSDGNIPQTGSRKGKVVLVGYGLDDAEGHLRYTKSREYRLLGGSEHTHGAMQEMAARIHAELTRFGYDLDNIRIDQLDDVRRIVDSVVESVGAD